MPQIYLQDQKAVFLGQRADAVITSHILNDKAEGAGVTCSEFGYTAMELTAMELTTSYSKERGIKSTQLYVRFDAFCLRV